MLKRSHRSLALALTPLLFIPIPKSDYTYINTVVEQFNNSLSLLGINILTVFFLIAYYIGSTFPDVDQRFKIFYSEENKKKHYLYHRQWTHSIIVSFGLLGFSLFWENPYSLVLTGFALGIITHQLGDILTGSIPWMFYCPYYIRFGRIGIYSFH